MKDPIIIAIDIGSPKGTKKNPNGKLGWYKLPSSLSENEELFAKQFAEQFSEHLKHKYLAIGIEAPLFIPVGNFTNFTGSRNFDDGHAWSAGAGANVTAIALPFVAKCLKTISEVLASCKVTITTDYNEWKKQGDNCILFWEAFISGIDTSTEKKETDPGLNPHIEDAKIACNKFSNIVQNVEDRMLNILDFSTEKSEASYSPMKDYLNIPAMIAQYYGFEIKTKDCGLVIKSLKNK